MKNKYKINIPLFLAGVLFCLTLISFNLTSNLYAKYSTSATGSDSARVAKFDVIATEDINQSGTIKLVPGDSNSSGTYTFTIKNNSEVVVKNTIIVKDVPTKVKVVFNVQEQTKTGPGDLKFDAGELNINSPEKTYILTFSALEGSTAQTIDVKIQVLTEQVD